MRARPADVTGTVERDGVTLGYEVAGDGPVTVLLLPSWTIIHARFWKMQVPYLARYYRVITYDGPGNGRSDRVTDPVRYSAASYAADAIAVLDACGIERAIVVGLSLGSQYGSMLASLHPDRVSGLVLVGAALPLAPPAPERASIGSKFHQPYPEDPEGWDKYNLAYWHDHYADFTEFFFTQMFCEPHSTKAIEDCVGWASETGPDVLGAEAERPLCREGTNSSVLAKGDAIALWTEVLEGIACPVLLVHGTRDRIQPHDNSVAAASITGGKLVSFEGSGHGPNIRDPVRFNHVLREFIERVTNSNPGGLSESHIWVRGVGRRKKALYLSSPIGLGHANRDVAIVDELRRLEPDLEVEWLAQHPVTTVLRAAGETIHPASDWLASESGHIASEASGHDLHCFQALRRMDEILVGNFMVFQEVVEDGRYDLVIGDESWDVDYYWHENPELKRGTHVWLTDFVGYLPMPSGGNREAFLTADYNAEMIEHIARYPRLRDRAIFVGNPDDIVPDIFGPDLPKIRDWTEEHFDFSGYVTGFTPPTGDEVAAWRDEFGYADDEKICVVTVGGSGVGTDLLEKTIASFPVAKRAMPELRMIAVAGPRIDPDSLPSHPGLEVRGYVESLWRHLAVCDLAVVQGGLTTTMELTAAKRTFLYFPLQNHFEQNFHVRYRLDQYGAGRYMDYAATDPDALAAAIVREAGAKAQYRDVELDGAARAAALVAELI